MNTGFLGPAVTTVLTVYGIETIFNSKHLSFASKVTTVLTVYGIETVKISVISSPNVRQLQQYLPFTVLKRICILHFQRYLER